jgi:hypothetical protein
MTPTPYDPRSAKKPLPPVPPDPKPAEPPLPQAPPDPISTETTFQQIDIARRYDVYCAETGQRIVIYRKVQFKSVQRLLTTQKLGVMSDFYELVMASGKSVFVTAHSIIKFHEHGVEPVAEVDTSM